MAIIRLALTNVRVQLNRSVSTLIVVGLAAMVLTSGLSMSQGTTRLANKEYRDYLGGDILVFSPGFLTAAPVNDPEVRLVRRVLIDSGFNPALPFFPTLESRGYFARQEWEYGPIPTAQLESMASLPAVEKAQPYQAMPAFVYGERVMLRQPPEGYANVLSLGRLPQDGSPVLEVVLNTYGFKSKELAFELSEEEEAEKMVGKTIELVVPAYRVDQMGLVSEDHTNPPRVYTAHIVGRVSWPTRSIAWMGPADTPENELGYIHAPEIYLTPLSWGAVWSESAGGLPYLPVAAVLSLKDLNQVNVAVAELRKNHPSLSVYPMSRLQQQAEWYNPIDWFYRAPALLWKSSGEADDFTEQEDFGHITAALLFLNAGMLMASQMLSSVAARKKEIGILRALGARQREVITMILVEALILTLIGATCGFGLVRLAAIHQAVTNNTPFLAIIATTLRELLTVVAATGTMSLVFGVLPALKVAKITVMEVFRNE